MRALLLLALRICTALHPGALPVNVLAAGAAAPRAFWAPTATRRVCTVSRALGGRAAESSAVAMGDGARQRVAATRDDPGCVVYLKGQSRGAWLPGEGREDFGEYCAYVERIIRRHGARRIVWDGGAWMRG